MKKTLLALALGSLALSATAQQSGGFVSPNGTTQTQGGFKGPSASVSTVAQAKTSKDDAWVVLEGHLVRQVGRELYEFRDESGAINIDIDDKLWQGQNVTPADNVRIEGEVDKDWNSVEIDAKSIRMLK